MSAFVLRKGAALSFLIIAMLGFAGGASAQNSLHGKWDLEDHYQHKFIVFNPDGRYFLNITYKTPPSQYTEFGYYTVAGDTITLRTRTEENKPTFIFITEESVTFTGKPFSGQTLQRDTQFDMAANWQEYDEAEAALDEKWRNFLTIRPMGTQPPHVPVGDVPQDPNITRIFPNPTVFDPQRQYTYTNYPKTLTFSNGETRTVSNKEDFHFLTTGRVYVRFLNYYPNGSVNGQVREFWGRYNITPGVRTDLLYGIVDALRLETDGGENFDMELHDGRRVLHWISQNAIYGQVHWENAALAGKTDPPTTGGTPTGKKGDVNGDGNVNVADAILILKSSVGALALTADQTARSDLNGDSKVDVLDAVKILRVAVGLESPPA
ncbi:MAG: dockerin type I repeat-containing protein [Armatimonadetes bacterium]|nr:dockerin type I repeat-containing protein [Armatimonadota bacterium]